MPIIAFACLGWFTSISLPLVIASLFNDIAKPRLNYVSEWPKSSSETCAHIILSFNFLKQGSEQSLQPNKLTRSKDKRFAEHGKEEETSIKVWKRTGAATSPALLYPLITQSPRKTMKSLSLPENFETAYWDQEQGQSMLCRCPSNERYLSWKQRTHEQWWCAWILWLRWTATQSKIPQLHKKIPVDRWYERAKLGELENEFLYENTFSINLVDNCMKHVIICLPQPSQTNIQSGAGYRCQ